MAGVTATTAIVKPPPGHRRPRRVETGSAVDTSTRHIYLLWTAMNEGLPGGTLSVSPESELEAIRSHVARWIGSQSAAGSISVCWMSAGGWPPRPRRR